jgi:hypothetical protein
MWTENVAIQVGFATKVMSRLLGRTRGNLRSLRSRGNETMGTEDEVTGRLGKLHEEERHNL